MFPLFTTFVSNAFVNLVLIFLLLPSFIVFLVVPSKPRHLLLSYYAVRMELFDLFFFRVLLASPCTLIMADSTQFDCGVATSVHSWSILT